MNIEIDPVASVVSLVSILVSAGVAFITSKIVVRDSERIRRIEKVCDYVEDTEVIAIEYWGLDQGDTKAKSLERTINSRMLKIASSLRALSKKAPKFRRCSDNATSFRKAVTNGAFGTHNRRSDAERINEIMRLSDVLINCVRNAND